MKLIDCKNGFFAQVDDEDFEELNKYKWRARKGKKNSTYYASRSFRIGERSLEKKKQILMHRQILGLTDPNILCDHEDHNGLNCQRYNLRVATKEQNARNTTASKSGTSKYLGVSLHHNKNTGCKRWIACIFLNKKVVVVGRFQHNDEGEILAAKAYDEKAKEHYKEFANINFK